MAGDDLLRTIADVMCSNVPASAILARQGDDEFGIALPDQDIEATKLVCDQLSQRFAEMRFFRDERSFKVSAGIGITQYTADCLNAEALLLRSDPACYLAKRGKRHIVQVFSLSDEEVARHQLDIGWFARISDGLDNDSFVLDAQRIVRSGAIVDLQQACRFFSELRLLSCRVALDDVGSGFNSLRTIRQIPCDRIKIDGSYVRNVCENALDRAFVESIQRIASVLQVETVAEFVEDEPIRKVLTDIGVDYLQGYGVHRPEPLTRVLNSLRDGPSGQTEGGLALA